MTHPIFRIALVLVATLALVRGGESSTPAPATMELGDKTIEILVVSDTLDGIEYVVGGNAESGMKSKTTRDKVKNLVYARAEDGDYLRGQANEKNDVEKAAGYYLVAAKSAKFTWIREDALVRAAECFIRAKKYQEAADALGQLETRFGRSTKLPRATYLRGELELARGNADAAQKAFATLAGKASDWGPEAAVMGAMGQANLLRGQKKNAEAAQALATMFADLKADAYPDLFGQVGLQLAEDQLAAGNPDQVLATCQRLYFAPIDETQQAQAHLKAAKLLAEKSGAELIDGFDHALMAAIIRGADGKTHTEAVTLVKNLAKKLETDPEGSKNKDEYYNYASNL
jgi:outer membrane protein assembly factor BamD (BamD/ComL family)